MLYSLGRAGVRDSVGGEVEAWVLVDLEGLFKMPCSLVVNGPEI